MIFWELKYQKKKKSLKYLLLSKSGITKWGADRVIYCASGVNASRSNQPARAPKTAFKIAQALKQLSK